MIYSRFRPDTGGYDYFESAERFGLGDDLPPPRLPAGTSIGVSSIAAGRTPGVPVAPVGSGAVARGMIMPTSRAGLSGLGTFSNLSTMTLVLIGTGIGWVTGRLLWRKG